MPSVSIDDIQVFIPTYKRPKMLRAAVESVLCQTSGCPELTILDNAGCPETRAVAGSFDIEGVKYHNTSALGRWGNFLMAQRLTEKPYTLLLHDDDRMYPHYLQMILAASTNRPQAGLITCRSINWPVENDPTPPETPHGTGLVLSQGEFATFVYNSGHASFSLAVYKTESFKQLNIEALFEKFGKWLDWPMMVEAAEGGAVVLLDYGGLEAIHPGQDVWDKKTLPGFRAWIEREKFFLNYMGDDLSTLSGASFCLMNYRRLRSGYKRRVRKEVSIGKYMSEARRMGALTGKSSVLRCLPNRLIQKLFLWFVRLYYHRKKVLVFDGAGILESGRMI